MDIEWADKSNPRLRLTNTKHTFYEILCACGHATEQTPYRSEPDQTLPDITYSHWRLAGPGLASLIICLAYRMRLSRERIQEFLYDWLGLQLSVGTINNTLHESGAVALPIEAELVKEVVESQLLHVDETSWMELSTLLWLWVFSTHTVTVFWIASRSAELIETILGQSYAGWLMSDGYRVYRQYPHRVRCWAHLLRKAEGLKEGLETEAQNFGKQTLKLMNLLMTDIYDARVHPPDKALTETYQTQLIVYRQLCEQMKKSPHKKAHALATEMLNDWEAIFRFLI